MNHWYYGTNDEIILAALASGDYLITPDGVLWITNFRGTQYPKKARTRANADGYVICAIKHAGKQVSVLLHRIVALKWVPKIEGRYQVNHKDGDKEHNHFKNLEWVTSSENCLHSYKIGHSVPGDMHGEKGPNAKLDRATVLRVRALRQAGKSYGYIEAVTGVKAPNVYAICKFKTWKHVTEEDPQ